MALDQVKDETNMSFLDHFDDLRKHLMRAFIYVLVATVICFVFAEEMVDLIIFAPSKDTFPTIRALCSLGQYIYHDNRLCLGTIALNMQNIDVAGQFMYSFRIAFIGGVILAFPFIINQLWKFVKPALSPREVKKTRSMTFYTTILFLTGVLFGYYMLAPISLNFFGTYKLSAEIENKFTFQSVINLVTTLCLATGLIFQLPLLMYFVARIGLLSSAFLKTNRRYAVVIMVILAAIVTPPDVLSQMILVFPLLALYELGVILVKRVERQREKENE